MMPKISICIPAYKADRYLGATLSSVRQQIFTDWELIVTEDGSRDSTEEIVRKFAAQVSQEVRYTRHEKNAGLPASRNTGFRHARAARVALLDSDDLWDPEHLANLMAASESSGAELVHAGSVLFDSETGEKMETRAPSQNQVADFPRSLFVAEYVIQPSSVMMDKNLWDRVGGFDPTFRYVEDREMWIRCARAQAKFAYTGKQTCLYRKHATALSQQSEPMALANAEVFEKNSDWKDISPSLRRRKASDAWMAVGRIVLRKRPHEARIYLGRALRHSRLSARLWAYWFGAVFLEISQKISA